MNIFTVEPQLPSWCGSKVTVDIGKAKIQPRIIIHLETLLKKAMQALLRVSPAGVKTTFSAGASLCWESCATPPLCVALVAAILLLPNPSFSSELISAGKIHF